MRTSPPLASPLARQRAIIGAVLAGVLPLAAAGPPEPAKGINRLTGVVVSKADGKPLQGAGVGFANPERGRLSVDDEGRIEAFDFGERVLFFFTKRNSQGAVATSTDAEGRFVLANFAAPDEKGTVVAAHPTHGVVLLPDIVPADYATQPLRIELGDPAFIEVPGRLSPDKDTRHVVMVQAVAKEGLFRHELPPYDADLYERGVIIFLMRGMRAAETLRLGPLPPDRTYAVSLTARAPRLGYQPTLLSRRVTLAPGQTVKVEVPDEEGAATVSGRVLDTEGRPLRDVNLTVTVGEQTELILGALTDEAGAYTVRGVPPGRHTIELTRHAVRTGPG